jgi:hypothetical protein
MAHSSEKPPELPKQVLRCLSAGTQNQEPRGNGGLR